MALFSAKLTRVFFAVSISAIILSTEISVCSAQTADLGFLDDVVGLVREQKASLTEQLQQGLGAVGEMSAEQMGVLGGVVSAGVFEYQGGEDEELLDPAALQRVAGVAALAYRALAAGLPGGAVEEIAQAALGYELDDEIFQAAVRVLDRLDRAGVPAAVVRSWLGYVLAEGWSAALLEAAGDGIARAVELGLEPEQMALALSVAAAQDADREPGEIVQGELDFLLGEVDAAERQRRERIYRALRAATAGGVPWRVAYGLYEHALLEGWSAELTEGILQGVRQGVAAGLPGEQLALALVVRAEQDGERVPVEQMVREEIAFVRQALGIAAQEPEPPFPPVPPDIESPPETAPPAAGSRAVSWKNVKQSVDSFLGVPYLWGGETRQGTDCSGFTQTVFSEQGVRIPRVSRDQHEHLKQTDALVGGPADQEELRRGDLVFFNKNGRGRITHVGMFVGDGKFAHASCSKGVVVSGFEKRYYQRLFVDGGRVCAIED